MATNTDVYLDNFQQSVNQMNGSELEIDYIHRRDEESQI
jgi:hypothetical protein